MKNIWIKSQDGFNIGQYTKVFAGFVYNKGFTSIVGITPQGKEDILGEFDSEEITLSTLTEIECFINSGRNGVFYMPESEGYIKCIRSTETKK